MLSSCWSSRLRQGTATMMTALSESKFEMLADETLNRMLEALAEHEDEDFEVDLESGVLTIEFADGAKYVINSHRAARQIWMAAETTAWHFDWTGTSWLATRSQDELWATVEKWVSTKVGRPLRDWPTSTP